MECMLYLVESEAVSNIGLPRRMREDRGGENVGVLSYMLRGRGRSSCIAGHSAHNQLIK